ncbi:MAG: cell division protein ZapB [Desulfobacteraceae bacterium]|nr:cell division protein ZapB [Desulfobacteraceae bacterium]
MEGMNLKKLEAVVEKMLANMQELRRDNAELKTQLANRNSKIEELEGTIQGLAANQEEVSSRVTGLISSIEEWERSLEDGTEAEMREPRGGGLFSMGE